MMRVTAALLILILGSTGGVSAGSHTLQYQYTAVGGINFIEFTAVGLLNGEQFVFYDTKIKKMILKTEWIQKINASDPDYLDRETENMKDQQDRLHAIIKQAMRLLNHTEGSHTLQYQYTAVGGINFIEFTAVGLLNGEQFVFYNSNIKKMILKTEWIQKISADDPDYLGRETENTEDQQDRLRAIIKQAMRLLNHTEGSVQWMLVCDDFNITRAYLKFSYNDSFIFHLNNETWTQCGGDGEAAAIIKLLEAKSAGSGRIILQMECKFGDEPGKGGGSGPGQKDTLVLIAAPLSLLLLVGAVLVIAVNLYKRVCLSGKRPDPVERPPECIPMM